MYKTNLLNAMKANLIAEWSLTESTKLKEISDEDILSVKLVTDENNYTTMSWETFRSISKEVKFQGEHSGDADRIFKDIYFTLMRLKIVITFRMKDQILEASLI